MRSKAKAATVAEKARMARLKEMPCVACSQKDYTDLCGPIEVHHLLSGNKRRGHMFTIPLCIWHHRGTGFSSVAISNRVLGPSLAHQSRAFHATFGTDDELLAKTNELLEKYHARRL